MPSIIRFSLPSPLLVSTTEVRIFQPLATLETFEIHTLPHITSSTYPAVHLLARGIPKNITDEQHLCLGFLTYQDFCEAFR